MKQFIWKIIYCVLPCVLAAWVTADAVTKYRAGESGGFKLGVDLVGGTILVYEIDLRKQQEDDPDSRFDPVRDINVLAESLKRRIDPNDLKNIVIRPAGGEGRVEIILPTGGTHRIKKAEQVWNKLLNDVEAEYQKRYPQLKRADFEVGRGRVLELADRIQMAISKSIWEEKLFATDAGWKRLKAKAYKEWAELTPDLKNPVNANIEALDKVKEGRLKKFTEVLHKELYNTEATQSEAAIASWLKARAWEEMLESARDRWPELKDFKTDMERVPPDSAEELVTFIQAKGVVIGQAALAVLEPILGKDAYKVELIDTTAEKDAGKEKEKEKEKEAKPEAIAVTAAEITEFVEQNYGPSAYSIAENIQKQAEAQGEFQDLSVEEVQRIKDLVAKVGSLEFRILANNEDDDDGQKAAKDLFVGIDLTDELKKRAKEGRPPPAPKAVFDIDLPRGVKSRVTYSWVELGPQERKQLSLDNAARNDPDRTHIWSQAQLAKNKAIELKDRNGRELLQGALIFTRDCEDLNLPEEDRRQKKYEYFVLTRDPEFDPEDLSNKRRVPKIDGSYLISAVNAPGSNLQPAVHFVFNNAGGHLFGELTRKNVPSGAGAEETQIRRHLAIILDGLVMSAPTINSEIRTHGQISGSFTNKEVNALVNILRAGRLPATLKPQPVSESTMGPTLGEDTIRAGVTAIVWAFVGVLAFMIVYYRFAGLVASIALFGNLILMVGFMVAVQATFTLPGLAGVVLTLGIAVDANILIYERLREERERGCSLTQAIRNGYDRAFPTIIDTHLASIFTAVVLYIVGNDQLKGFGVSLTVGLVISLFTSLVMTRLIFDIWHYKGWLKKLSMMKLFARPDIDFMGIRNVMFLTTVTLALAGIVLFIGRLPDDLNIDFRGGTAYGGEMTQAKDITELRELLDESKQEAKLLGPGGGPVKVEPADDEGFRYTLTYEGDQPLMIAVANKPEGAAEDRVKAIQKRASKLPDVSVELYYPSVREDEGKRTYFNVRTSEKEPDLVQAMLDRLLRADGQPLMKKVYMQVEPLAAKSSKLKFYADLEFTQPAAGSLSFVKSLFQRELLRAYGKKEKSELPFQYDIVGEGRTTEDGKNHEMLLKFESELPVGDPKKTGDADKQGDYEIVQSVLASTVREFAARPQPDRLENFDSQLAAETRLRAMWAVLASWGAILLYLWFRFGNWTFGLAAVICLIHDLFLTMGAIAACHYIYGTFVGDILGVDDFKLDLASVAALLTLVGYSVNDTIVVFDRIRELRGKNPNLTPQMINDSVNQTLSRTVLASFTTWIVVLILYIFGGPTIKLFAFVMVFGVVVGTYSSIYIASPLLLFFGEGAREGAEERRPEPVGAEA
ncbi:MAG: protein translocase subunit SecD [Gemmataceae bacterium]|nr:protein translocase subunit SecD [Gemmataceae bacterium]